MTNASRTPRSATIEEIREAAAGAAERRRMETAEDPEKQAYANKTAQAAENKRRRRTVQQLSQLFEPNIASKRRRAARAADNRRKTQLSKLNNNTTREIAKQMSSKNVRSLGSVSRSLREATFNMRKNDQIKNLREEIASLKQKLNEKQQQWNEKKIQMRNLLTQHDEAVRQLINENQFLRTASYYLSQKAEEYNYMLLESEQIFLNAVERYVQKGRYNEANKKALTNRVKHLHARRMDMLYEMVAYLGNIYMQGG